MTTQSIPVSPRERLTLVAALQAYALMRRHRVWPQDGPGDKARFTALYFSPGQALSPDEAEKLARRIGGDEKPPAQPAAPSPLHGDPTE